ncbi:MAG: YgiQ family radical SAM protein, partial [Methylophilaceae bacterium]
METYTSMLAKPIQSYRPYWAKRFGTASILPTSREEMDELGWDSCDIILITGDAYIDHPSFGMALVGRLLEAQGFRVGIIAQPDWQDASAFKALGKPNLYFGITSGNMDSMVNRYTADRKVRSDDAYTPDAAPNKRPDRAVLVYSQRCREAYSKVPVVIGSIEASLRRIAHYDYWSDKVRRSVLVDSKADILIYGNAERALVELTHRIAKGELVSEIQDIRGTAFMRKSIPEGWDEIESTKLDRPGTVDKPIDPYEMKMGKADASCKTEGASGKPDLPEGTKAIEIVTRPRKPKADRSKQVVRLPDYEEVSKDPVLYAHASRVLHLEANPGNARALIQKHGDREVWLNPPPIPLTTKEMDFVYDLPYARKPHPIYKNAKIPAWEMIRFSVNIMRGCFGGCTFCSITEHEGRIIQSRSEASVLKEVEEIRDKVDGFTGVISDLG